MIPVKSSSAPIEFELDERLLVNDHVMILLNRRSPHRFYPFCYRIQYEELYIQSLDAKQFLFEVLHLIESQELLPHHLIRVENVVLHEVHVS